MAHDRSELGSPPRVGLVINPIAGMGGRVGLKGTDGVAALARERGAEPSAVRRATEMLCALRSLLRARGAAPPPYRRIHWLTCAGSMGAEALEAAGIVGVQIVHTPGQPPDRDDTVKAVEALKAAGAGIVVFCGGDGTARDVVGATGRDLPVLGIPAGVKMYSAVFGISPARTAEILLGWLEGRLGVSESEVLDVDEDRFREGVLEVRLYGLATTPHEPHLVQSAKTVIRDASDEADRAGIAEHVAEEIRLRPDTLFLLGPGSTVAAIAHEVGVEKSLLGVDAVYRGERIGRDLAEREILALLDRHPEARLVLSPLGSQGFVLGRGNQQLSPDVVRRLGRERLVVVATPMKLDDTPALHLDTGDPELDAELAGEGFLPVVTGYHLRRLARVEL